MITDTKIHTFEFQDEGGQFLRNLFQKYSAKWIEGSRSVDIEIDGKKIPTVEIYRFNDFIMAMYGQIEKIRTQNMKDGNYAS